jgi:hypothetical protein
MCVWGCVGHTCSILVVVDESRLHAARVAAAQQGLLKRGAAQLACTYVTRHSATRRLRCWGHSMRGLTEHIPQPPLSARHPLTNHHQPSLAAIDMALI